jgi:hypothetical protein
VEVEERTTGATFEELDPAAVDGERALAAGRGYGLFHHVQVVSWDTAGIRSTIAFTIRPPSRCA